MAEPTQPRYRVAVLSRRFERHLGGAENYAVSLVEELAAQHDITVFCKSHGQPLPGVRYCRMTWGLRRPRWIDQWLFALWAWWQTRHGFDVVHSHENVFHGQVQTVHVLPVIHNLFANKQGGRWLMTWLKVALSPRLLAYVVLERLRLARHRHRIIVAASQPLADVLSRRFHWLPGQLQVLPPGVRVPPSQPDSAQQQARAHAREALKLPPAATLLLMIGHDYRKKGLGALLQALARLPRVVHLVVVGQSSQIPEWAPLAAQAGLTERVHFLGVLHDTRPAYEACDILVHATLEDTFGMVTLEAMAHRLPLIVSRAPYCLSSSQLQDGQQALILQDPTSPDEIADCVERILDDAALRAHLTAQALRHAQDFAWPALAQRQSALYRLAIEGVS
jgi:UDP-glucose:(heptosyl)LPS alpha-1,3-glucosyltransferase